MLSVRLTSKDSLPNRWVENWKRDASYSDVAYPHRSACQEVISKNRSFSFESPISLTIIRFTIGDPDRKQLFPRVIKRLESFPPSTTRIRSTNSPQIGPIYLAPLTKFPRITMEMDDPTFGMIKLKIKNWYIYIHTHKHAGSRSRRSVTANVWQRDGRERERGIEKAFSERGVDAKPAGHDRIMLAHCPAVDWLISSGRLTKPHRCCVRDWLAVIGPDRRVRPRPAQKLDKGN